MMNARDLDAPLCLWFRANNLPPALHQAWREGYDIIATVRVGLDTLLILEREVEP